MCLNCDREISRESRLPIEHSRLANYIKTRISIGIIRTISLCVRGAMRRFGSGESLSEFE